MAHQRVLETRGTLRIDEDWQARDYMKILLTSAFRPFVPPIFDLNAGSSLTPILYIPQAIRCFQVLVTNSPLLEPLLNSAMATNAANPPAMYPKMVSRNPRKRPYDSVFPPAPCSVVTDATIVSGASSAFFLESTQCCHSNILITYL